MLTSEKFFLFCQTHRELRIERTASGKIIIMPPADGETGARNADLVTELGIWARINNQGKVFGSSTGFDLPNGATRSPDAAWVRWEQLAPLTAEQKRKFLHCALSLSLNCVRRPIHCGQLKIKWSNGSQTALS